MLVPEGLVFSTMILLSFPPVVLEVPAELFPNACRIDEDGVHEKKNKGMYGILVIQHTEIADTC